MKRKDIGTGFVIRVLVSLCKGGHVGMVQLLLEKGVDVNEHDSLGCRAIIYASKAGQVAIIDVLLEHGGDIDSPDLRGDTTVSHAAFFWATQNYSFLTRERSKGRSCKGIWPDTCDARRRERSRTLRPRSAERWC